MDGTVDRPSFAQLMAVSLSLSGGSEFRFETTPVTLMRSSRFGGLAHAMLAVGFELFADVVRLARCRRTDRSEEDRAHRWPDHRTRKAHARIRKERDLAEASARHVAEHKGQSRR